MIQKLIRRISWRVSFFAYIWKSPSLLSICWRVCQKELDLYMRFHYNKSNRKLICVRMFLLTQKFTKMMRRKICKQRQIPK